ncbi:ABC transporter ATP-binding protein [Anaerocolumna cellulosilytica]|uniref:ABC transporter ATP-binding protein n=1 Tax=Anaerocolumna cellulosilytica TaxID=433286 RepID=A0A6S6RDM3_9FIRM|nr:ABC transporter ATP-binding protein [Anaerocolumna cellulosilytica]MBB5195907.1 ABC-2 type transport system ATP-binding protein [Anaerocolumna cellulosilytica]BCJ96918.1 ABC transporter ATP-binding protein [Anaerocolumna cellulosilytica]
MNHIVDMEKVRKNFDEKEALRDVNVKIEEGEIFGFLGPSGAGKTTTIKLLTGQLLPSSGKVNVLGKEVYANKKFIFDNIGILSDNSGIYDRLSVWDNMVLFAELYDISKERIAEVLEKVGLHEAKKTEGRKLSKGMKQRLMLARAVLHKPKLLFLDEPTAALDPGTTLEIHKLLKSLNAEGTTIFLTTHNMVEADKLCHRVAFLNNGEIVECGKPSDLKLKYITDDITVILNDNTEKLHLKNCPKTGEKIMQWMKEKKLRSVHSEEPTLEKIFLMLTGREL